MKFDFANLIRNVLAIISICFVLFFLTPIYMAMHSDNGFQGFDYSIFLNVSLVYSALSVIIFFLLAIIFWVFKFKLIFNYLIVFTMVWVVLSAFLFPVSGHSGMVLPDAVPVNMINLFIVFAISFILAYFGYGKLVWMPYIFTGVLVIGVALEALQYKNLILKSDKVTDGKFGLLSPVKNIIVLSFDGLPANIVEEVLENNEQLRYELKDFTFFTNAFSSAPATTSSLTSELFGNRIYRDSAVTGEKVDLSHEISLLPLNRIANSYSYGYPDSFIKNHQKIIPRGLYSNDLTNYVSFIDSSYRLELSLSRSIGSFGFKVLRKLNFFNFANSLSVGAFLSEPELKSVINKYKNPIWKLPALLKMHDFFSLTESLSVNLIHPDTGPGLRMMHFSHTHFPVDLDENCNIRSIDKIWVGLNQNHSGLFNQTTCALNQFVFFIEKIKQIGVYDSTMIILKSDHGEPAYYYEEVPYSLKINGHSTYGLNRYMPLLMLKNFNSLSDSIDYNNFLVGLPDIARTVCLASELDGCDFFNGVNLAAFTEHDIIANPDIFIDVVINENSNWALESQKTIKLNRNDGRNILELFEDNKEIVLD